MHASADVIAWHEGIICYLPWLRFCLLCQGLFEKQLRNGQLSRRREGGCSHRKRVCLLLLLPPCVINVRWTVLTRTRMIDVVIIPWEVAIDVCVVIRCRLMLPLLRRQIHHGHFAMPCTSCRSVLCRIVMNLSPQGPDGPCCRTPDRCIRRGSALLWPVLFRCRAFCRSFPVRTPHRPLLAAVARRARTRDICHPESDRGVCVVLSTTRARIASPRAAHVR